jgi:NADP-dependent 3-hydroxy acid dehydrogenase YdfG
MLAAFGKIDVLYNNAGGSVINSTSIHGLIGVPG